jgi:tight adherence protein B
MRRALAALLAVLGAALVLLPGGQSASAQQESALAVRAVDATDPSAVKVTFTYAGDRNDLRDLAVREGARLVDTTTAVPLGEQQSLGIALVIDTSGSMKDGALIERVLEAAHSFVDGKSASDQVAIVTFDRQARLVQDFTTNKDVLDTAIDKIALGSDTALYDGIVRAAALFADSSLQPNLVVFSDGGDTVSSSSADRAQAAVENIGGALFALGVENDGFKVLEGMARDTGGTSAVAGDPAGVGQLFDRVQATLQKQYVVTFPSKAADQVGAVPLTLSVGDQRATAEYVPGSRQGGAASLRPQVVEKPSGPGFLRSDVGLVIGLVLLLVAVAALVMSLGDTFFGEEHSLNRALQPYADGYVASGEFDDDEGGDGRAASLAQTPLLQRAVDATGEFAERRGLVTKVESLLERANLPLRPAEAVFFYLAGVVLVLVLLIALSKSLFIGLIGGVIVAMIPPAVLSFLAGRRQKQFNALLPDTLQLLASTLRAGYSLMQGVEAVSQEVSEPIGRELRRVVTEARLGRPLEESLDGVAVRMDSDDFGWAVMAIRIQREVGGNLAELLVTVAETMTERERLRRDVNALTAEGKISAIVLGILPFGIGLFIMGANPGYLDPLFDGALGKGLLVGAGLSMLAGFYWMKKTIEIEI